MNYLSRFVGLCLFLGWSGWAWACPTCSQGQYFTPRILLFSLFLSLVPISLTIFIAWRLVSAQKKAKASAQDESSSS